MRNPSRVSELSVWNDTNRELFVLNKTIGTVCPVNVPSGGADSFAPSYTWTLSQHDSTSIVKNVNLITYQVPSHI